MGFHYYSHLFDISYLCNNITTNELIGRHTEAKLLCSNNIRNYRLCRPLEFSYPIYQYNFVFLTNFETLCIPFSKVVHPKIDCIWKWESNELLIGKVCHITMWNLRFATYSHNHTLSPPESKFRSHEQHNRNWVFYSVILYLSNLYKIVIASQTIYLHFIYWIFPSLKFDLWLWDQIMIFCYSNANSLWFSKIAFCFEFMISFVLINVTNFISLWNCNLFSECFQCFPMENRVEVIE